MKLNLSKKINDFDPASKYVDGFPIGNGSLGAMILGGVPKDIVSINEESIWSGSYKDRVNPDSNKTLKKVRELILDGYYVEAENLYNYGLSSIPNKPKHYQKAGDLAITLPEEITKLNFSSDNYKRSLDISTGVASVSYDIGNKNYNCEYFVSREFQSIFIIYDCSERSGLSINANLNRSNSCNFVKKSTPNRLELNGGSNYSNQNEGFFTLMMSVRYEGSKASHTIIGNNLSVNDADIVIFSLACCSAFRYRNHSLRCKEILDLADSVSIGEIRSNHIKINKSASTMISFSLDDDLSYNYNNNTDYTNLEHASLIDYFNIGRYLLNSSSSQGSLPALNSGIWQNSYSAEENSFFKIDINTQLMYHLNNICSNPEQNNPLYDFFNVIKHHGRGVARKMYNSEGFIFHSVTDVWGDVAPSSTDKNTDSNFSLTGAIWQCLHLWDHYQFTKDKHWLRIVAYPIIREISQFFLTYMQDQGDRVFLSPTQIPKCNFIYKNQDNEKIKSSLTSYSAVDMIALKELFFIILKSSEILDLDDGKRRFWKEYWDKIPNTDVECPINSIYGQENIDKIQTNGLCLYPFYSIFPGNLITKNNNKKSWTLAHEVILKLLDNGVKPNTYLDAVWLAGILVRLKEPEMALDILQEFVFKNTSKTLLHYTDELKNKSINTLANVGASAVILEMILQSHDDCIEILPALPKKMSKNGMIDGLKARGNIKINIYWNDGILDYFSATPLDDTKLKLKYKDKSKTISAKAKETLHFDSELNLVELVQDNVHQE